nr:amidophosphoribosyltransferase [Tessaracoccus massiliensis]
MLGNDHSGAFEGPKEECGVFGVFAPEEDVAQLTYYGLFALQHRGQESAGMAVSNLERIMVFKDMGLVSQIFDQATLRSLQGRLAIGHTRYATTGASVWQNAQPTFRSVQGKGLALAHNGNITNTHELEEWLAELAPSEQHVSKQKAMDSTNDTTLITALIAAFPGQGIEDIAMTVLPRIKGAFCLTFMTETTLFAARDPQGVRPLVLGRLSNGWVVASETAALDLVGASFIREVEPGELLTIDEGGIRSRRFAEAKPKGCIFEYVYVARPDTTIAGSSVNAVRIRVGEKLAEECPAEADMVIPVPQSGIPSAVGFARASGIPYGQGLVKNNYVGRTFIEPSQTIRQLGIRLKLNPLREEIGGKRLVVVDDSIVRGNTQRALVRMLREAGAAEVHVRISSPPVEWPCFYGIDFSTRAELIAPGLTVDQICRSIGADSLGFVSLEGLTEATQVPAGNLCRACFDGNYPIAIPPAQAELLKLEKIT